MYVFKVLIPYWHDRHYFLLPLLNIVWNTKQSKLHKYIGLCNTIVRIYKQTNSVRGGKMVFDPIWPVITKLHLALFESLSAFLAAVVSNCVENTHARTDAQCILTQLASQRAWDIERAFAPLRKDRGSLQQKLLQIFAGSYILYLLLFNYDSNLNWGVWNVDWYIHDWMKLSRYVLSEVKL